MNYNGIYVEPLLPNIIIIIICIVSIVIFLFSLYFKFTGIIYRNIILSLLIILVLNPIVMKKNIKQVKDIVLVINDLSQSQLKLKKTIQGSETTKQMKLLLTDLHNLEIRTIEVKNNILNSGDNKGTNIFYAVNKEIASIPPERLSAIIIITDGQVHDTKSFSKNNINVPIHVLLTGKYNELDRRIVINNVPKYGIVGEEVAINLLIEDIEFKGEAQVDINLDNKQKFSKKISTNKEVSLKLPIKNAGEITLEIKVEEGPNELLIENNSKIITLNGVYDRLRVMLISGEPNMALRSWRNLLNADPAIELIHFTILRPPNKRDLTPVRELSLIPFPTRELFAANIEEFDLIIFDQYSLRGILPPQYLNNIVEYVYNGGAVLDATGPSYASQYSLSNSPLKTILPTDGPPVEEVLKYVDYDLQLYPTSSPGMRC